MAIIVLWFRLRRSLCQNGKDWKKESGSVHVGKLLEIKNFAEWRRSTKDSTQLEKDLELVRTLEERIDSYSNHIVHSDNSQTRGVSVRNRSTQSIGNRTVKT